MTVVIDAGTTFSALTVGGRHEQWSRGILEGGDLIAPELLALEVAHIARRAVVRGELRHQVAWKVVSYAKELIDLVPHAPLLPRVWALRDNVTSYDAAYVAVAELWGAPLATLDTRLCHSTGPRCDFLSPD